MMLLMQDLLCWCFVVPCSMEQKNMKCYSSKTDLDGGLAAMEISPQDHTAAYQILDELVRLPLYADACCSERCII
jgi:hypothetical protein